MGAGVGVSDIDEQGRRQGGNTPNFFKGPRALGVHGAHIEGEMILRHTGTLPAPAKAVSDLVDEAMKSIRLSLTLTKNFNLSYFIDRIPHKTALTDRKKVLIMMKAANLV